MLDCVTQCSQSAVSSSYRSKRFDLSHWDPYTVHRGSCLELYYCNMVEWFWWDSSLIFTTNWFGHLACKSRPRITYNVSSGTLSLYTATAGMSHRMICTVWLWISDGQIQIVIQFKLRLNHLMFDYLVICIDNIRRLQMRLAIRDFVLNS